MRASVWIVVLIGAVGVVAAALWTGQEAVAPSTAEIAVTRSRAAAEARAAARRETAARRVAAGVSRDRDAGSSLALVRDRGAGAEARDAVAERRDAVVGARAERTAGSSRVRGGLAPGRDAAPAPIDRNLERSVARLGQELDLPALPHTRGSRTEALEDEAYVATVADAAVVEYLLREALWEQFHSQNKLVPWGFPLNQLRDSLAGQVAGLSNVERNALLALAEERLTQQAPPVMSKKIEYQGGDFEGSPSGVDVLE